MGKPFFDDAEAVLFDFEGTLVDLQWNLQKAVKETLEMLKSLRFPIQQLQGMKYSTLMLEAQKMAPEIGESSDWVRERIGVIFDRFDEDAFLRWRLRGGSREFLSALKKEGKKIGLVTNVGRKALEKAMTKLGLRPFFDVVVSRNDVQRMKPNREGLLLALRQLRVIHEKAVYVGDSLDDIEAAKAAGIKVILITDNGSSKKDLLSSGPDRWIHHLNELLPLLAGGKTTPSEM